MATHVDVLMVNYHSADDIKGALEALGRWQRGRIWLVDNNGDDSERFTLAEMAEQWQAVTVLTPTKNLGFGRGCNLAWERSEADYVLLLNPDARMAAADLDVLCNALDQDSALSAVSPATFWNPERTFVLPRPSAQSAWAHAGLVAASWWPWMTRQLATAMANRTRAVMHQQQGVLGVGFLAGAALLLRRSAVAAAGGLFDPQFFMFFEDADLSVRLRRAGYRMGLVPAAQAVHTYRHEPFKAGLMTQSQRAFFQKNHPVYWLLSGHLAGVERLTAARQPDRLWFALGELASAAAFGRATGWAGVDAFSPSVRMFPAIVRPVGMERRPWNEAEWALLEPGPYVALLTQGDERQWVHFVKVH